MYAAASERPCAPAVDGRLGCTQDVTVGAYSPLHKAVCDRTRRTALPLTALCTEASLHSIERRAVLP